MSTDRTHFDFAFEGLRLGILISSSMPISLSITRRTTTDRNPVFPVRLAADDRQEAGRCGRALALFESGGIISQVCVP
jgi:hypothetical protein